jgi:hypothetical protein
MNKDIFCIYIWSSPLKNTTEKIYSPPETIFNCVTTCRDSGFLPLGTGIPVIDESTGYAVAELFKNSLFIWVWSIDINIINKLNLCNNNNIHVYDIVDNYIYNHSMINNILNNIVTK